MTVQTVEYKQITGRAFSKNGIFILSNYCEGIAVDNLCSIMVPKTHIYCELIVNIIYCSHEVPWSSHYSFAEIVWKFSHLYCTVLILFSEKETV